MGTLIKMSKPSTAQKKPSEEKSGSAKNEASEKRSSAVSKKRASVSSASSSKSKVDLMENGRGEAVKTAEKKERVPTGKASEERPPTTSGGAEENKETTENEDMRKTQSTPVILEKDVERVKAKIKTGEDIDAHEILRPVLFMLDDMRRNIRHIRKKNGHRGGEMEIVNGGDSNAH